MAEHFGRRGLLVLISDLYEEPDAVIEAIGPLRFRGNDLAVFHLLDPAELDFSFTEPSAFEDLESGEQIPIVPDALADQYKELVQAHINALRERFSANRIDYTMLNTSMPLDHALFSYLSTRERLSRVRVPMSFLTPLFLVGLAGLAIPVILHLIQKERKNVVQFPSLMFLRRIPYQSVRRRRIRHWLLLFMRLAALALIVLAFARPFLRRTEIAAGASGAREVVILLDRSYSMGYGGKWAQAITAAERAINGLAPADRASIVLFSSNTEVALRSAADRGRLLAAVAGVQPGAGGTRFGPALKLAGSILGESAVPRREAVLISDFQRGGWQGGEGVRLPDGAVLTPVVITDTGKRNLAIAPVSLQQSEFQNQQRITVTTGAVNHTDVAGVERRDQPRNRRPRDPVPARQHRGPGIGVDHVRSRHRRRPQRACDGASRRRRARRATTCFHFVVSPEDPVDVIIAERGERPGSGRNTSLYLTRAVAVSETPRIDAKVRQADSLSNEDLAAASVVILNDAPIAQTTAERLQAIRSARRRVVHHRRRAGELAVGRRHPARACLAPLSIDRAGAAARARRARVRSSALRSVPRAADGRLRVGALLWLSQRDARTGQLDAGAFRRWAAGAARASCRDRPGVDVDLDARHDVDRPRPQAGVRALRSSHHPLSGCAIVSRGPGGRSATSSTRGCRRRREDPTSRASR